MTQEEIRRKYHEIHANIWKATGEEEKRLREEWNKLKSLCSHPDKEEYSICEYIGEKCPDCGWETY